MHIEEIKKKDWQVLTAYTSLKSMALLKTIFENQAVILSKTLNMSPAEIMVVMEENLEKNYKIVCEAVKKEIPDYPTI